MAKRISNMNQLQAALMPEIAKMEKVLVDRVYQTLNYFLQEYYNSYDPKSYKRQYDFLRSAIKVEPKIIGNKVVASVYIDTDSMDNYYDATGYMVVYWADRGLHGGLDTGDKTPHVWNDTMDATVNNWELLNLAMEYLKSKGVSVRG